MSNLIFEKEPFIDWKKRKIVKELPGKIIYFSHIENIGFGTNIVMIEEILNCNRKIIGDYGILTIPRLQREIKVPYSSELIRIINKS